MFWSKPTTPRQAVGSVESVKNASNVNIAALAEIAGNAVSDMPSQKTQKHTRTLNSKFKSMGLSVIFLRNPNAAQDFLLETPSAADITSHPWPISDKSGGE
jgi:hypothetical protein